MEIKSKATLDVPIEDVFATLSDFEGYERSALRRGIEVERLDTLGGAGVGAKWDLKFQFRGKDRQLELELVEYNRPEEMVFKSHMQGLDVDSRVELVALSRTRTRINVAADLKPQSLPSKLLVQSLKLAKAKIAKRMDRKLAGHAKDIEDRYRRSAG
ncbi:SRPBCC family protein [Shimia biformata]|uniref:SRPBCC family protein n=1 Tax=Shimia biformata TaxID=1294299 RepID=UPI0019506C0D|nr:SRPBCC family protein [Shimia biformata]